MRRRGIGADHVLAKDRQIWPDCEFRQRVSEFGKSPIEQFEDGEKSDVAQKHESHNRRHLGWNERCACSATRGLRPTVVTGIAGTVVEWCGVSPRTKIGRQRVYSAKPCDARARSGFRSHTGRDCGTTAGCRLGKSHHQQDAEYLNRQFAENQVALCCWPLTWCLEA